MRRVVSFVAMAWLLAPSYASGGGTLSLVDIEPLLRQAPALREFLASSVELGDTVMAAIRLGPHFEHLGGGRMGPYVIEARPTGSKWGRPVELILCTDARFVDDAGHAVQDETKATRVEERLAAVMLREVGSRPAVPACPGN